MRELQKELKKRVKKAMKEILCNAEVVLGTLASSINVGPMKNVPENHFNMTVIDECSQVIRMEYSGLFTGNVKKKFPKKKYFLFVT